MVSFVIFLETPQFGRHFAFKTTKDDPFAPCIRFPSCIVKNYACTLYTRMDIDDDGSLIPPNQIYLR